MSARQIGIRTVVALLALGICSLFSDSVHAEQVPTGKATIKLNVTYPKFTVDGKRWEHHFFLADGKELVVHSLPTDKLHTIVLTALDGRTATVTIKPKKWRKRRVKKKKVKTYEMIFKTKAKLKKGKTPKKPKPKK